MKAANAADRKKNGLLVLSGDNRATASVLAGAWIGANQMTLFENRGKWGSDLSRTCAMGGEQTCRLVIDMDARRVKLSVNGTDLESAFSESMTSVNYVGFGVLGAETLFSEPVIRR
jgi:hypothetical protein